MGNLQAKTEAWTRPKRQGNGKAWESCGHARPPEQDPTNKEEEERHGDPMDTRRLGLLLKPRGRSKQKGGLIRPL